jgi:tetratricopeptide (TPR) repeat protein/TolB-like protein
VTPRLASLTAGGLLAAATLAPAPAAAQAGGPGPRIMVMPFENASRESRIFWLGEAVAVLLTDDLTALGANAIVRDERRAAFDRLRVPPASTLTDATVIRIGQLLGAAQAIVGSLTLDGDVLVVQARSIGLEAGRLLGTASERGPVSDLFAIAERVARRLAPSPSAPTPAEVAIGHPPIAAFENYIKGLLAETPATAINYLNTALAIAPTFVRPRLALWELYAEQGDYDRALAAVKAVPASSPWSRRARFLAGLAQLHSNRYAEAFEAFQTLAAERPTAAVLNNLGVVQLRRGASPRDGEPAFYFTRAADTDGDDADYFFNLGYAYWLKRDAKAAIYWLREAVRRNPADGEAHFILGAALAATGNATGAVREKELARRLSSTYEEWGRRPAAEQVPSGLERIKDAIELPTDGGVAEALASASQREQREQQDLARFYLDRGRRLFQQENDRDALNELQRALFLSPYQAEAHLLVGRIHMRAGRLDEAVDALKISLWSQETSAAHVALAEAYLESRDVDLARAEAQRALALDPTADDARRVLAQITP